MPSTRGRAAGSSRPAPGPETTKPCIIRIAITGSLPRKADDPAVPVAIPKQIETAREAFAAGTAIVHCHVRNDDGGHPPATPCASHVGRRGSSGTVRA